MSENCDVTAIFSIDRQFAAVQKPDSGSIVSKTYVFINPFLRHERVKCKLLSYKNWKQN